MKNFIKKSLAFMLVAALALTCFVGSFSVSAEDATSLNANISVTADPVTLGATEATATIKIDMVEADAGINEALIKVSSTIGTVTNAVLDTAVSDYGHKLEFDYADGEGTVSDYSSFYLSAISGSDGENGSVMGTITSATITVTFNVTAGAGEYPINIDIPESKVIAASKDEVAVNFIYDNENPVSFVVEEAVTECDHANATKEVTTQPTKDAEGVMTYTCECGETWTEAIAKPVATTAVTLKSDIIVSSVVGSNITISTKQMRTTYGDDATYFIVVDYQKYGSGDNLYMIENVTKLYDDSNRIEADSTANKSILRFAEGALSEMTLDFTITAYFVNAEGVVVGYRSITTNIANMALAYAPTASATLLTALADMCNYGASAIEFFARTNPGTDICNATLPTTIFADYMSNASTTDGMPTSGFNDVKTSTKVVSTTGFVSAGQTLVIGASNQISYTLRYDNYAFEDIQIKVYYEDSINGLKEVVLTQEDLVANGTTGAGMPKFLYYFDDLSIYDFDKTVTMEMYYNGTKELYSEYSLGNFVNTYIGNATYTDILSKMLLFANSVGVQLQLDARW